MAPAPPRQRSSRIQLSTDETSLKAFQASTRADSARENRPCDGERKIARQRERQTETPFRSVARSKLDKRVYYPFHSFPSQFKISAIDVEVLSEF